MSYYKQQEVDFINRTKRIIEQYNDYFKNRSTTEKYEVTLLLNAFVGLLVLPQQEWFNLLPNEIISSKEWGISAKQIGFINDVEGKTVKNIARHFRNSITHYRFNVFQNSKDEISQIQFLDYMDNDENVKTFEAVIPLSNLRDFLNKFSDKMIEIAKAHNNDL